MKAEENLENSGKHPGSAAPEQPKELDQLRAKIDALDQLILSHFAARMEVAQKIGEVKREHQLSVHQGERWLAVLESRFHLGQTMGLRPQFIHKLLELVHEESKNRQSPWGEETEAYTI